MNKTAHDNRRPWWRGLLIRLSGPAILLLLVLTVFAVYERGSERTVASWDEEVSDAFIYYVDYYLIPVARAADPSCDETIPPADASANCEDLIRALTERADELDRAADNFESLADNAPSDAPSESKQAVYETARVIRSMWEGDEMLIAGWSERDEEKWESGWRRREEARQSLRNLSRELSASTP